MALSILLTQLGLLYSHDRQDFEGRILALVTSDIVLSQRDYYGSDDWSC
jgi:hypothetical protein